MLLIALLATADVPAPKADAVSQATIRVERPVRMTRKAWEQLPPASRSERRIVDEGARERLLRLVELP